VPSNGTVEKIFTHPEKDLDGEFIAIQENLRNLPIYLKAKGHLKCFLSLRTFMNTT
jgi:hypothetical protein